MISKNNKISYSLILRVCAGVARADKDLMASDAALLDAVDTFPFSIFNVPIMASLSSPFQSPSPIPASIRSN